MGETRIYIGNLGLNIKEIHLMDHFSSYGNVSNIEIKSKFDVEGNPVSRFAYLNLESVPAQINECVHVFNGSSWKGSIIKVEIARESFLERLKREREHNNKTESTKEFQKYPNDYKNNSYNFNSADSYERKFTKQYIDNHSFTSNASFSPDIETLKVTSEYEAPNLEEEHYNQLNILSEVLGKKNIANNSNKESSKTKTFSTFRRYDPTTAPENQESNNLKKNFRENVSKDNQNFKKFVQVSSDLSFKENSSSSFSLLAKFSQQEEMKRPDLLPRVEEEEEEEEEEQETFSSLNVSQHPSQLKSRNFFIRADDPELQEGVEWLTRPMTEEIKSEFEAARLDLVGLYKLRRRRAERELKTSKRFRRGKKIFNKF